MRDRVQRGGLVAVGAAAVLLLCAAPAPAQNVISASRVLVHLDGVIFGPPNIELEGGGAVHVDTRSPGKSAGLQATGGGSVGVEVRVTKIVWLDAAVGRRWLLSMDLQFTAVPRFTDLSTGQTRDLQSSGMFLKLGVGRRF